MTVKVATSSVVGLVEEISFDGEVAAALKISGSEPETAPENPLLRPEKPSKVRPVGMLVAAEDEPDKVTLKPARVVAVVPVDV